MQKRAILLVAVSAICAFAEKDYDEAIEPFQNSPGSVLTEAAWIEPHDETYLPYNACSEVQGLDFVKLEEQVGRTSQVLLRPQGRMDGFSVLPRTRQHRPRHIPGDVPEQAAIRGGPSSFQRAAKNRRILASKQ